MSRVVCARTGMYVFVGLDDEGLVDKEEFTVHLQAVLENSNQIVALTGTVKLVVDMLLSWCVLRERA